MGIDIVTVKGTPVCLSTHSISNLVWSRDPGKNNSLGLTDVNVCQILYLYLMKIDNGRIQRMAMILLYYYNAFVTSCSFSRISFVMFHCCELLKYLYNFCIYISPQLYSTIVSLDKTFEYLLK